MSYAKLATRIAEQDCQGKTDEEICAILMAHTLTEDVDSVSGQAIFEAIVPAEYASLTAAHKDLLHAILGMGQISIKGTNTRAALAAMFGAGTTTRANLTALQTRATSWANLNGWQDGICPGHVASARTM